MTEKTLLVIKPDAVQRGLIGEVISRVERKGLKIISLKMVQLSGEQIDKLYDIHYKILTGKDGNPVSREGSMPNASPIFTLYDEARSMNPAHKLNCRRPAHPTPSIFPAMRWKGLTDETTISITRVVFSSSTFLLMEAP